MTADSNEKNGIAIGVSAYVLWGVAPVFFKLLASVPATVIIAHRIVWALLLLLVFLLLRERQKFFQVIHVTGRQMAMLALSGSLVVLNWLVFVWAVNQGQIMATSLGYFINPLVNILLGLVFFNDRLNKIQVFALLLATASTVYLGFYIGEPPWIALTLGFSFGFYGLVRKKLGVRPMVGLFWETALLTLPALGFLWLYAPVYTFDGSSEMHMGLLFLSGLVTVIPLICFNVAAKKLTLSMIGFLQYIAPTISFLIAVLFYDEIFTRGHQIAFTGIWLALILISCVPMWKKMRGNKGSATV
ncbi:EamA family transporter RarD [Marinicella sp. W31]|uniref:EamA family transporter RarD n=1 Tax=Marinicella sp. W31 TaxID=3023713 RepID=UPI003757C218